MNKKELLSFVKKTKLQIMIQSKFNGGYRFVKVDRSAFITLLKDDFSDSDETGIDPIVKNDMIWMEMNATAEH